MAFSTGPLQDNWKQPIRIVNFSDADVSIFESGRMECTCPRNVGRMLCQHKMEVIVKSNNDAGKRWARDMAKAQRAERNRNIADAARLLLNGDSGKDTLTTAGIASTVGELFELEKAPKPVAPVVFGKRKIRKDE